MDENVPPALRGSLRMAREIDRAYDAWQQSLYQRLTEEIEERREGVTRSASLASLVAANTGLQPSEFERMPIADRLQFVVQTATRMTPADELEPCHRDILETVAKSPTRLTTTQLLSAMDRAGLLWGESTIKMGAASLVKSGRLINERSGPNKGYGLPE